MGLSDILTWLVLLWIIWKIHLYFYKLKNEVPADYESAAEYVYRLRNTIYLDNKGYERDGYNVLIHRRVAWEYLYDVSIYPQKFRYYDIHHIDKNKRNNSLDNLQILTREEHKVIHGF